MAVVECRDVVRTFKDVRAVDGVSLQVRPGEVFGIVGPNGAGKTTLLNCVEGLDRPTSGSVRVLGLDPVADRLALVPRMGVQLQSAALPPRLTVAEAMRLYSALYENPLPWPDLLERLGIADKQRSRVDKLSGGQRQRVFIALALMHAPELVVLDEVTTGLDPQARLAMWDVVREIRDRGATVVMTTHAMDEAQALCDRVGIIDAGRLIALDTVDGLIASYAGDARAEIELEVAPAGDLVLASAPAGGVERDGNLLVVTGSGGLLQDVLVELDRRDLRVRDLRVASPDLEDVFLNLTGRPLWKEALA